MLKPISLCALGLLAAFGLSALAPPADVASTAVEATEYKVDTTHSSVLFKTKHMGVSWFYGRFNEFSGKIDVSEKLEECTIEMEVVAASIDSRSENLDEHLKSGDFFDVEQFPTIKFESVEVNKGEGDDLIVTGDLELHGVSEEIDVTFVKVGEAAGRRGKKIGYHATFSLDRGDYGMKYGLEGADEDAGLVEMIISIEANAR